MPPTRTTPMVHSDLLIEMLEVFTHNILYMRRVYPFGIFQRRRLYNCVVYRSRFPTLNEYITNALLAAQFLHKCGALRMCEVVLSAWDPTTVGRNIEPPKLESYFFELSAAGQAAAETAGKRTSRAENAHAEYERTSLFEEKMRASLLTLDAKCKNLRDLPNRVVFSMRLHTTQSGHAKLTDDVKLEEFPWMVQDPEEQEQKEVGRARTGNEVIIVPLADVPGVHIYAESYRG